jgi:nucleoside-diphosphate-sugar epimerase
MENDTDVYLVAGATGRTGVHITKELLAKGKKVRILIRNIDRAWGYFKEKMSEFESVVICDILSNDYAKSLEEAFAPKNGNQVKYVISTLSYRFEKTISCEDGNYTTNKRLIDIAKPKISRSLYCSAQRMLEDPTPTLHLPLT